MLKGKKITAIAFANSVKVGRSEEMYLGNEPGKKPRYDIEFLTEVVIKATCLVTNMTSYTTLFNTKWWKLEELAGSATPTTDESKPTAKRAPAKRKL